MVKKLFLAVVFTLLSSALYAADLKTDIKDSKVEFIFSFQKGYSTFEQLADERHNTLIFTFDTSEKIAFDNVSYYDIPLKRAYLTSKDKVRFFIEFKETPIEPIINKTNRQISIVFPLPAKAESGVQGKKSAAPAPVETGSYARVLIGLTFVLIMIMLLFYILKIFFKKQIYSDIPGSGRLLGKGGLELRKTLYFY